MTPHTLRCLYHVKAHHVIASHTNPHHTSIMPHHATSRHIIPHQHYATCSHIIPQRVASCHTATLCATPAMPVSGATFLPATLYHQRRRLIVKKRGCNVFIRMPLMMVHYTHIIKTCLIMFFAYAQSAATRALQCYCEKRVQSGSQEQRMMSGHRR